MFDFEKEKDCSFKLLHILEIVLFLVCEVILAFIFT